VNENIYAWPCRMLVLTVILLGIVINLVIICWYSAWNCDKPSDYKVQFKNVDLKI
jgi:hypothetical protein